MIADCGARVVLADVDTVTTVREAVAAGRGLRGRRADGSTPT